MGTYVNAWFLYKTLYSLMHFYTHYPNWSFLWQADEAVIQGTVFCEHPGWMDISLNYAVFWVIEKKFSYTL